MNYVLEAGRNSRDSMERERSRIAPGSAPRSIWEERPAAKRTKLESGRPGDDVESTTARLS